MGDQMDEVAYNPTCKKCMKFPCHFNGLAVGTKVSISFSDGTPVECGEADFESIFPDVIACPVCRMEITRKDYMKVEKSGVIKVVCESCEARFAVSFSPDETLLRNGIEVK